MNGWLASTGLAGYNVGAGTATLSVVSVRSVTGNNAFTVQSRGVLGSSATTVLSEFSIGEDTRRANINVPAALTSRPSVYLGNNINVVGVPLSSASGVLSGVSVLEAAVAVDDGTSDITLSVSNDAGDLVGPGDFLQIAGVTYTVLRAGGGAIDVRAVDGVSGPLSLPAGTAVGIVDVGLTQQYVSGNVLTVNNPDRLAEGGRIRVGSAEARVVSVSPSGSVAVEWDGPPPATTVEVGAPIASEVYSVYTAGAFNRHQNNTFPITWRDVTDGTALPEPTEGPQSDDDRTDSLFYQTFGQTKADFLAAMPESNIVNSVNQLPAVMNGETYVLRNDNMNQARICGTGILIVMPFEDSSTAAGNETVSYNASNCPDGQDFRGLIYVSADLAMRGRVGISGAIVVEGRLETEFDTEVDGAGQTPRITYDRAALLAAAQQFPMLGALERTPGTWRQQ